jgi:N-acyl-D-amino-acid deacylase
MRTIVATSLICVAIIAASRDLAAQDLVIVNARILDGKGGAIERGSVVVRGGRIASVSPGRAGSLAGAPAIDAQGRTLMPGFIDDSCTLWRV